MRDFVISTDSNADIPLDLISQYGINVIPTYYSFGETIYGDEGNTLPAEEFYQLMKDGKIPTSQACNPAVIEDKFRSILESGKDIIHIAFSSELSGSYGNVCMVANELRDEYTDSKITIIDSLTATLCEGIIVLSACQKKNEGLDYEATVDYINAFLPHSIAYFTVNDLFHLQRGGRVSKTTAVVGSTLKLKPFMFVTNKGTLSSEGTFHGRKKALSGLVDKMIANLDPKADTSIPVGIVHGNCYEEAKIVAEMIAERTPFKNTIINDINPSIGTHSGPGTIAVCFYGAKKPAPKEK